MKLSVALFGNVLFATTIFAAPSSLAEQVQGLKERRSSARSALPIAVPVNEVAGKLTNGVNVLPTQYYTNWAGAVISPPPADMTFYAVIGTLVVPLPSPPTSGAGTWSGSGWVGISDVPSIVQAGVDWSVTVSSSGDYSYAFDAWYEWYPNESTYVDLVVNAGDVITIWCETTTPSAGFCIINNESTGVSNTYDFSAPSSQPTISGTTVEWIVEDFMPPFANFGGVTFTNCVAVAAPDFNAYQYVYPNASTAYAADIVALNSAGAYQAITAVSFPTNANQAVEINYIGFQG